MSRRGDIATPSQLERGGAASPSPARNALQGNLESGLTLNRKKSWFGSARDILSKALRVDGSAKADENDDRTTSIQNEEAELGQINDSSNTPLKSRTERQRTFTPRNAISSLRQHISSSNHRHKRPALADLTGNEMRTPVGPERLVVSPAAEEDEEQEPLKGHTRKNSLGRSLVGSIRTFSRKSTMSRTTSPTKSLKLDQFSPTKQAAAVPLPSSPIDIAPPPTLQVDLGPSALLSTSPQNDEASELMRITNPTNLIGERPVPTYYTRLPGEGPSDQRSSIGKRESLTPSDLLQLPTDDFGFSVPEAPTTPGPSRKSGFQFDGANDETELFERSVEYKDKAKKKENRTLKKMVSLDAMAEECTNSPASNSKSPRKLSPANPRESKDQLSLVTINSCPDDMPEITRQLAHLQTPSAGHRNPASGKWQSEDPFAPGNVVGDLATSGPPSPEQNVKLAFRPKITLQTAEATEPKTFDDSELATPEIVKADGIECTEDIGRDPFQAADVTVNEHQPEASQPAAPPVMFSTETVLAAMGDRTRSRASLASTVDSGEYGEFKTQQLFGDLSDPVLPEYVDADADGIAKIELALHKRASVAQLYQRISNSQTPIPPRCRPNTTHSPDVGDVFWKFNLKSQPELSEDGRTAMRAGNMVPQDSEQSSVESVVGPDNSLAMTAPEHTPNMGDRLEFDIKRSERNMRYNALSEDEGTPEHEDAATLPTSLRPLPLRPTLKIDTTNEFRSRNSSDLSLASFNRAYASSRQSSPLKLSTRQSRVGMSSDSIDPDLKRAISQHYVFQAAVAGLGITEPYPPSTANATPSESHPMFSKNTQGTKVTHRPAISPESSGLWQDMEHGPFDTPPGGSDKSDRGESNDYEFRTPFADSAPADDSLDDCLEMFHNFNKSQDMLSSDTVQPTEKIENPFKSSPSKAQNAASSSPVSPNKKPPPARYRNSMRGRK